MEKIQTITLSAKEVVTGNKKFYTYVSQISGKWYKVKFNRDCINAPQARGLYDVVINLEHCSVQNGKLYTKKDGTQARENPTIWISKILKIRKYSKEELQARSLEKMEAVCNNDPLPF